MLLVSMLTLQLRVCPFACATPPARTVDGPDFFFQEVVAYERNMMERSKLACSCFFSKDTLVN